MIKCDDLVKPILDEMEIIHRKIGKFWQFPVNLSIFLFTLQLVIQTTHFLNPSRYCVNIRIRTDVLVIEAMNFSHTLRRRAVIGSMFMFYYLLSLVNKITHPQVRQTLTRLAIFKTEMFLFSQQSQISLPFKFHLHRNQTYRFIFT